MDPSMEKAKQILVSIVWVWFIWVAGLFMLNLKFVITTMDIKYPKKVLEKLGYYASPLLVAYFTCEECFINYGQFR